MEQRGPDIAAWEQYSNSRFRRFGSNILWDIEQSWGGRCSCLSFPLHYVFWAGNRRQ